MRMVVDKRSVVPLTIPLVHEAAWATVERAALVMSERAKRSIRESHGTGVHWPSLPNRSSVAFKHPVNQHDALIESIQTRAEPLGPHIAAAECFCDDPAIAALEEGTSRMEPRPFFTEASYAGEEVLLKSAPYIRATVNRI